MKIFLIILGGLALFAFMLFMCLLIVAAQRAMCDNCPNCQHCDKHEKDDNFVPPCMRDMHINPFHNDNRF